MPSKIRFRKAVARRSSILGKMNDVSLTARDLDSTWLQPGHPTDLYLLSVMDRVSMVKEGLPAEYVEALATSMAIPKEKFYRTIGIARPTVDRKIRQRKRLSQDESERVLGIARLIGQAQSMVQTTGGPHAFDAAKWLASWLDLPLNALDGRRPAELMDTADGRTLIADILAQQQSSAYA